MKLIVISHSNTKDCLDMDKRRKIDVTDQLHGRMYPRFHFRADDIALIESSVPIALKEKTLESANAVVQRSFSFRNIAAHTFAGDIDWSFVPKGNISWHWDLNRHHFFLDLAKAYYYTGNETYLNALIELWDSWMRQNPPGKIITWRYSFGVAARLQNWIWGFFLLLYSGKASEALLHDIVKSMRDHADYLYWNLEYSWSNNHLLLESKAM